MKLIKLFGLAFDALEFRPQIVQKQRANQLEDVLFRGVVRTEIAAHFLIHDGLKQRLEYGRRNPAPIQRAAL